ncbi:helix-turn-helix domain-containing protein [Nocardia rhamnosiphila]|uniref:helix-turn-helix domain-containing protein n=1 Tax=Nocardia rhamnosiphila TaxID=426716 RepID=UPI0034080383
MARAALREDQPVEQVAEAFGVSRATLYRYLAGAADAESMTTSGESGSVPATRADSIESVVSAAAGPATAYIRAPVNATVEAKNVPRTAVFGPFDMGRWWDRSFERTAAYPTPPISYSHDL